jgi:hypothetical protein
MMAPSSWHITHHFISFYPICFLQYTENTHKQVPNNMSSDSNTTNEQKKDLNEDETIDHFFNLVQNQLATSDHLEDLLLGGGYDDAAYKAEEDLLMKVNNNGLLEGAVAGVTTFACLVAGPPLLKRFIPPKTYKFDAPKTRNISKYVLMGMRLGVQAAASLVIAAYTTSYFTDEEFMLEQVSRAPLLEGKSVISDEFCPTICREYYRYSQDYWKGVKSPYLQNLTKFVENCERRRSLENNIRVERGLSQNIPISIPSPGVPKNYPIDETVKEQLIADGAHNDWVEVLVTDQEEYIDENNP